MENTDEFVYIHSLYTSGELIANTTSSHQRHLSDGSIDTSNDLNMYQVNGTMTLGRDKKKTSKIKKFFKKLSSKKDGVTAKIEIDGTSDYFSSNDGLSRTSTSSSTNSSANLKLRRRSDGTLSLHSIQDLHYIHTPNSRRRTFLNLSFMKKVNLRRRSNTYHNTIYNDDRRQSDLYPSETIRALCSPDMSRKHKNDFIVLDKNRRGSDPSLYRIQLPAIHSTKRHERPPPPTYSRLIRQRPLRSERTSNNSSVSSYDNDEADYANYPFSKTNVKAPQKPQRFSKSGSCSDPFSAQNESFGSNASSEKPSKPDWRKDSNASKISGGHYRLSATSSDASSVASNDYLSSKKSDNYDNNVPIIRSSSSLRRTPLRRSIDSFNNLLEVHKQTIDKIAFEISRLHCECSSLQQLDWGDFERGDEMIQLGLSQYMIVPVTCAKEKKNYTAWLKLRQQRTSLSQINEIRDIDYTKTTLHRNCLHVCHSIEQKYASPNQDGIPTSIQIDYVYISPQAPKMSLAKYTSITLEKHTKYPEMYEREAAMILLQVIKSIEHYYRNDVIVSSVDSDNVFILKTSDPSITLSPRREPNKCPAVALAVLPGLGNNFENSEDGPITNVCYQLAFLLLELLHSPYHDELRDAIDMSMLLSTLPDLTIKSTYTRYLQYVITFLLGSESHRFKTFEELKLILGVILFGPTEISDHTEEEAVVLINKWHNRRCVDMVTHILKEAPLIMLYASGTTSHEVENLKAVDQEIILECEFLSEVTPADIFRISKTLNR